LSNAGKIDIFDASVQLAGIDRHFFDYWDPGSIAHSARRVSGPSADTDQVITNAISFPSGNTHRAGTDQRT
jgi:hypothetical protein